MTELTRYQMYINGEWVDRSSDGEVIPVLNPATEEQLDTVPNGSKTDVDQAVQAIGNFGRGSEYVVFELPADVGAGGDVAIGVSSLICYEGIFPALTRNFVAAGARLLVNISNDAWYGRTSAPHQHLAMAAVRAVENRVPVVRATNTGVSAFVDAVGRIRGRTPLFEEAVAVDDVVIADTFSLYRTLGDWFVYLCMIAVAALAALRMRLGSVLIRERERGILPSR